MGRCKTTNKGGTNTQRGASPFPSLQDGEDGDMVQDPVEEIAAMEEVFLLPPKHLLDLGDLVNCHWRGQYPLSIDEATQLT